MMIMVAVAVQMKPTINKYTRVPVCKQPAQHSPIFLTRTTMSGGSDLELFLLEDMCSTFVLLQLQQAAADNTLRHCKTATEAGDLLCALMRQAYQSDNDTAQQADRKQCARVVWMSIYDGQLPPSPLVSQLCQTGTLQRPQNRSDPRSVHNIVTNSVCKYIQKCWSLGALNRLPWLPLLTEPRSHDNIVTVTFLFKLMLAAVACPDPIRGEHVLRDIFNLIPETADRAVFELSRELCIYPWNVYPLFNAMHLKILLVMMTPIDDEPTRMVLHRTVWSNEYPKDQVPILQRIGRDVPAGAHARFRRRLAMIPPPP